MKYFKIIYEHRGVYNYIIIFCHPSVLEEIFRRYMDREKILYDSVEYQEWGTNESCVS